MTGVHHLTPAHCLAEVLPPQRRAQTPRTMLFHASIYEVFRQLCAGHRTEVCTLSRRVMLKPLSGPFQPSIRFFRLLLPAQSTTRLATRLPRGQLYGLTTFPLHHTTGLGSAFSPAGISTTCSDL
ncbi:hypothetical protein Bxe_A3760 [Paraburkholderia xenovorans LB400]|uniref:Uncharacterized protein n=1 Tax=Paraburkholderia xenovorans (strain LB400) TaxID=266265 RepID=Q144K7_PARXL|nr:hypothetical protein Bxe_A3760 [Paraburkholderia xenovorans LB400]